MPRLVRAASPAGRAHTHSRQALRRPACPRGMAVGTRAGPRAGQYIANGASPPSPLEDLDQGLPRDQRMAEVGETPEEPQRGEQIALRAYDRIDVDEGPGRRRVRFDLDVAPDVQPAA